MCKVRQNLLPGSGTGIIVGAVINTMLSAASAHSSLLLVFKVTTCSPTLAEALRGSDHPQVAAPWNWLSIWMDHCFFSCLRSLTSCKGLPGIRFPWFAAIILGRDRRLRPSCLQFACTGHALSCKGAALCASDAPDGRISIPSRGCNHAP